MWIFYETETIADLDFSQERISPLLFTNCHDIISFAIEKYKLHSFDNGYLKTPSRITMPDINTLYNITGAPYEVYEAHISDRVWNGYILTLENYLGKK
jgi:hypothetical protein